MLCLLSNSLFNNFISYKIGQKPFEITCSRYLLYENQKPLELHDLYGSDHI